MKLSQLLAIFGVIALVIGAGLYFYGSGKLHTVGMVIAAVGVMDLALSFMFRAMKIGEK